MFTTTHFLSLQKDPVPPELVLMLQQSQDFLLQKLFPVAAMNQQTKENDIKAQTKPVVVTVVSKFKVCFTYWLLTQRQFLDIFLSNIEG